MFFSWSFMFLFLHVLYTTASQFSYTHKPQSSEDLTEIYILMRKVWGGACDSPFLPAPGDVSATGMWPTL